VLATEEVAGKRQLVAAGDRYRLHDVTTGSRINSIACSMASMGEAVGQDTRSVLQVEAGAESSAPRADTATRSPAAGGRVKAAASWRSSGIERFALVGAVEGETLRRAPATCHVTLAMAPHSALMLVSRISSHRAWCPRQGACASSSGVCCGTATFIREQLCRMSALLAISTILH